MATKKVKWYQKDGTLLHPETEWSMIVGAPEYPNISKLVTTDTTQTITGNKSFKGFISILDAELPYKTTYGKDRITIEDPDTQSASVLDFPINKIGTIAIKEDITWENLPDKPTIPTIPNISCTVSGSGNAVTGITASGHAITVTKGETFALKTDIPDVSKYLPFSGGELTGNLKVGSATIQTNGYITGTWLQTTSPATHSGSAATKVAIIDGSGWIYHRTPSELLSDMGGATTSYVDTKATWNNITGKPSWIGESKPTYNFSEISGMEAFLTAFVTTDSPQTISEKKIFTGYYMMDDVENSKDTATQFYGLRIKGENNSGEYLHFGDGNFCYFYEYEDDCLRLHTAKFDLEEGFLSLNGDCGMEGQVLTSHGEDMPPTWEFLSGGGSSYTEGTGISISSSNVISTNPASASAVGHVTTAAQTFAGTKTFNGGINIPSGATIQLAGSSGTSGYVLTSNGTSVPSWKALPTSLKNPSSLSITVNGTTTTYDGSSAKSVSITTGGSKLDAWPVGSIYICWYAASSTSAAYHPAKLLGGSWSAIPAGYALWTWNNNQAPTASDAGHEIAQGLPNITGEIRVANSTANAGLGNQSSASGAFSLSAATTTKYKTFADSSSTWNVHQKVILDASKSGTDKIYGKATGVQPYAYKVFAWRRTA